MRIGHGYDVHKLVEGRKLILGGIEIPFEKGLLGHSDADVLTHALMDALLGAAALGDIGKLFPDNDPAFAGADSVELLKKVCAVISDAGYRVGNVDCTVIAQRPKLAPFIPAMREKLANAMDVDVSRVSVKATTEEHLGFTGEGLGRGVIIGFSLATIVFAVAYAVEVIVLKARGNTVRVGFFTMGFSLTGEAEIHRGVGFILMCVFFNIVNVVMEEGTFRGLFYEIIRTDRAAKTAVLIQALLFGIWHVVTPLHNLIDGDIDLVGFVWLSVGYIILAGIMGIKWSLMYRMTRNLYAGMADHFFNNCIATNLLHLTTESGTDEWMIVRVLIAQLLSSAVVAAVWTRWKKQNTDHTKEDEICSPLSPLP